MNILLVDKNASMLGDEGDNLLHHYAKLLKKKKHNVCVISSLLAFEKSEEFNNGELFVGKVFDDIPYKIYRFSKSNKFNGKLEDKKCEQKFAKQLLNIINKHQYESIDAIMIAGFSVKNTKAILKMASKKGLITSVVVKDVYKKEDKVQSKKELIENEKANNEIIKLTDFMILSSFLPKKKSVEQIDKKLTKQIYISNYIDSREAKDLIKNYKIENGPLSSHKFRVMVTLDNSFDFNFVIELAVVLQLRNREVQFIVMTKNLNIEKMNNIIEKNKLSNVVLIPNKTEQYKYHIAKKCAIKLCLSKFDEMHLDYSYKKIKEFALGIPLVTNYKVENSLIKKYKLGLETDRSKESVVKAIESMASLDAEALNKYNDNYNAFYNAYSESIVGRKFDKFIELLEKQVSKKAKLK